MVDPKHIYKTKGAFEIFAAFGYVGSKLEPNGWSWGKVKV